MTKITNYQLFSLIVLVQIGSTTLFALGIKAKQDAWISILVAMAAGLILMSVYIKLQKNFPGKNLAEIITTLLGKVLGAPLIILYGFYFMHIATFNYREFGDLINITFLPNSPVIVILIIFLLTVFYILFLGLDVFSRLGEILCPFILFFIIGTYILISISGQVDLNEIKPILGYGIEPVLQGAYPQVINFPFGEMIVFLMYWRYTKTPESLGKTSMLAILFSGILLTISLIIMISVLGVELASSVTIPFLEVIKLINIADVITNLDAVGIIIMFIGGFFKMTIFFYGGILAFSTLFKGIKERILIIIGGIFILFVALFVLRNRSIHLWLGQKVTTPYIHLPFQMFIPILLVFISSLKKDNRKSNKNIRK